MIKRVIVTKTVEKSACLTRAELERIITDAVGIPGGKINIKRGTGGHIIGCNVTKKETFSTVG